VRAGCGGEGRTDGDGGDDGAVEDDGKDLLVVGARRRGEEGVRQRRPLEEGVPLVLAHRPAARVHLEQLRWCSFGGGGRRESSFYFLRK
jgi:hypothetical protein